MYVCRLFISCAYSVYYRVYHIYYMLSTYYILYTAQARIISTPDVSTPDVSTPTTTTATTATLYCNPWDLEPIVEYIGKLSSKTKKKLKFT